MMPYNFSLAYYIFSETTLAKLINSISILNVEPLTEINSTNRYIVDSAMVMQKFTIVNC